jgi:predicted amidohydrolase
LRIAVLQHKMRTHERMDLAALLALSEEAAEEHAQVLVYPCVPGIGTQQQLMQAFAMNVIERVPGAVVVAPCVGVTREGPVQAANTPLGSTVVLSGDDFLDPAVYDQIQQIGPDALVWQSASESDLQAEAILELALDTSLSLCGLVLVAATIGRARGVESFGVSAIVHLGEILAEGGDDEAVLTADVVVPVTLPERRGPRPVLAPVLAQRLAVHRGAHAALDHVTDEV